MQRTDPLEEALRGSGFLWRPQPRRRQPLGPGVSAPPPWLRIDEKRLFVYVSEHGAEPQPARVAAIVRKAGDASAS